MLLAAAGRSLLLAALVSLLLAGDSRGAVTVRDGVAYGQAQVQGGPVPLLLDLYRPAKRARTPRPVVIVIHGGGFVGGSRKDAGIVRIARALATRGIVAASIDYRLMGSKPVLSGRVTPLLAGLPDDDLSRAIVAAVDDTLTAIRYLRSHAKALRINVRRLGLIGSSAGAITADHVAYALDDHGIARPSIRFVGSLWGGILVASPQAGQLPASQLDRGEAALFAVHGDADTRVPVALSDQLVARADAQGVRNEYHRIAGGGHGFALSRFFTTGAFERLIRFARARLR